MTIFTDNFPFLGKSRADLWQLASLIALEQTIERANRACDLDFHARQQVCNDRNDIFNGKPNLKQMHAFR